MRSLNNQRVLRMIERNRAGRGSVSFPYQGAEPKNRETEKYKKSNRESSVSANSIKKENCILLENDGLLFIGAE